MKKHFIRGKIFVGDDQRLGMPLCRTLGKAVFAHASNEIKSPFIMVSRDDSLAGEMLQVAVGDAICGMGGEVLLVDGVSVPAAALLTQRYRADFTVAIAGGYIEILTAEGQSISREQEQKIEKIMGNSDLLPPQSREGDFYSRRDAYLDYCTALYEIAGERRLALKIEADCAGGCTKRAAKQVLSRLTKNLFLGTGGSVSEAVRANCADVGLKFDQSGRGLSVTDERGGMLSQDEIFCLLTAKIAEKDLLGGSLKERGVRLVQTEGEGVHFEGLLPAADAIFTAVMLCIYISDKEETLSQLTQNLKASKMEN